MGEQRLREGLSLGEDTELSSNRATGSVVGVLQGGWEDLRGDS